MTDEKKESAWVSIAKNTFWLMIHFLIWVGIGILWGMNPLVAVNWAYQWIINSCILLLLIIGFIGLILGIIVLVMFLIEKIIDIRN